MIGFDLETTGTDPATDRIVTATVAVITPGQEPVIRTWLADPGIDIPTAASDVHGITTEHARAHGKPAGQVVADITATLLSQWHSAAPCVAFNACFDLSLLAAELHRHHGRRLRLPGPVVDPLVIDKEVDRYRKGKRTLTAACAHYEVKLGKAHDSSADTLGALRIAWRLAKKYPEKIGNVDLRDLHDHQVAWYRTQQHGFADYLDRLAAGQNDAGEAEQLTTRAAGVRANADTWPMRIS